MQEFAKKDILKAHPMIQESFQFLVFIFPDGEVFFVSFCLEGTKLIKEKEINLESWGVGDLILGQLKERVLDTQLLCLLPNND